MEGFSGAFKTSRALFNFSKNLSENAFYVYFDDLNP